MDAKKMYGVERALGTAIAKVPGGLDALRGFQDKRALYAYLGEKCADVPPGIVEAYVGALREEDWPKARAKLVLATRAALGEIALGQGHEAGRGVRRDAKQGP